MIILNNPFFNRKIFSLLILVFSFFSLFANSRAFSKDSFFSFNLDIAEIGESRIPIDLKNFPIHLSNTHVNDQKITAKFIQNSAQWVRTGYGNLLAPRARISIRINNLNKNYYIKIKNKTFLLEQKKDFHYIEIFVSLFNPEKIDIFSNKQKIQTITITAKKRKGKDGRSTLIDYSCAPYHLEILGAENEYLSASCLLSKTGKIRNEKPRLVVTWMTTNLKLPDGTSPPFVTILTGNNIAKINLIDQYQHPKLITIKAQLPNKIHRLKTALGLGPYSFHAEADNKSRPAKIAPAAFLYGKYEINDLSSWRGFNATIWNNKSFFNNIGFYFAYEVATAFDKRVSIIPLLGLQGLSYKYDSTTETSNKMIYPQGFEIVYKHPFGLKNYSLVYGMFLGTSSSNKYQNVWLRYGKGIFWELNYIGLRSSGNISRMWGLSVGLPFIQFF